MRHVAKTTTKKLDIPVFEEEPQPRDIVTKIVKAEETTTPPLFMSPIDWSRWLTNAVKFLAPLLLIYVYYVNGQVSQDGLQLTDFIPNEFVSGGIVLYILNTVQDFLRKFIPSQTTLTQVVN